MSISTRFAWTISALVVLASCQVPGTPIALDDYHTATDREATEINVLANDYFTGSNLAVEVVFGPSCGQLDQSTSTVVVIETHDCVDVITLTYRIADEFGRSGEANVEITLPGEPDGEGEFSLVFEPESVDFGEVESGTMGRHRITVTNDGTALVEVFELVTAPDTEFRVESSDCEGVIEPGADCFVELIFTPTRQLQDDADLPVSTQVHEGTLEVLDDRGAILASTKLEGTSRPVATTTTTFSTTTTTFSTTTTTFPTTSTSIPSGGCVDFEDMAPGVSFGTGEIFSTGDVDVVVSNFVWSDGTVYDGGEVAVTEGLAGGTGNELFTNNVLLRFGFPSVPLEGLSLDYGAHGGNLNIEVNGDFVNFGSFDEIDGTIIGGVSVSVLSTDFGDFGSLVLTGSIREFAIGGQEFAIDNLCT
jgi:hypothetical protein